MSRGNTHIHVRAPQELHDALAVELQRHNDHTSGDMWSMSDLILALVRRELAKRQRSRTQGGRTKARRERQLDQIRYTLADWSVSMEAL